MGGADGGEKGRPTSWQKERKKERGRGGRRRGAVAGGGWVGGQRRATRTRRPLFMHAGHGHWSRATEWRARDVKWKDDTHPPANIFPTIILLIYIAREIALQDHRAEIVAEEAAHRELALLLIT